MIIETVLSSISQDGKVNFAPIGVHVPDTTSHLSEVKDIEILLYSGSNTFSNLKTTAEGVINFTDDISIFVDTALFSISLPTAPSLMVRPPRMAEANTVWEFSVTSFNDSTEPARVAGKVLSYNELAGFTGLCRARGVIIEATILATRIQWIPVNKIEESWRFWQEVVIKTGGIRERQAFQKVSDYFIQQGISIPHFNETYNSKKKGN